jgi:hypothetical protein
MLELLPKFALTIDAMLIKHRIVCRKIEKHPFSLYNFNCYVGVHVQVKSPKNYPEGTTEARSSLVVSHNQEKLLRVLPPQ